MPFANIKQSLFINIFGLNILVDEKLHWAFKLYDKDGNGEIDPEEMQEMFSKLCSLVNVEKTNEAKEREKEDARKKLLLATKLKLQQAKISCMKWIV